MQNFYCAFLACTVWIYSRMRAKNKNTSRHKRARSQKNRENFSLSSSKKATENMLSTVCKCSYIRLEIGITFFLFHDENKMRGYVVLFFDQRPNVQSMDVGSWRKKKVEETHGKHKSNVLFHPQHSIVKEAILSDARQFSLLSSDPGETTFGTILHRHLQPCQDRLQTKTKAWRWKEGPSFSEPKPSCAPSGLPQSFHGAQLASRWPF